MQNNICYLIPSLLDFQILVRKFISFTTIVSLTIFCFEYVYKSTARVNVCYFWHEVQHILETCLRCLTWLFASFWGGSSVLNKERKSWVKRWSMRNFTDSCAWIFKIFPNKPSNIFPSCTLCAVYHCPAWYIPVHKYAIQHEQYLQLLMIHFMQILENIQKSLNSGEKQSSQSS